MHEEWRNNGKICTGCKSNKLCVYVDYDASLWGMWSEEHYRTLLMGEVARLHDTKDGYGPNGSDFIAHVDVPDSVLEAYTYLKELYPDGTRQAK